MRRSFWIIVACLSCQFRSNENILGFRDLPAVCPGVFQATSRSKAPADWYFLHMEKGILANRFLTLE